MSDGGNQGNDIVSVNKALEPKPGSIVVETAATQFTCKKLFKRNGRVRLVAANPAYPDIRPKEGETLEVWGVVTASLTLFRN